MRNNVRLSVRPINFAKPRGAAISAKPKPMLNHPSACASLSSGSALELWLPLLLIRRDVQNFYCRRIHLVAVGWTMLARVRILGNLYLPWFSSRLAFGKGRSIAQQYS
jgi:hypothetical protein